MGPRPLVVQDAHDTKFLLPLYWSAWTPMTTTWESFLVGAKEVTFARD